MEWHCKRCKTCKIRRVKCDEQASACQRCCSTGRKCDGYDVLDIISTVNRPYVTWHPFLAPATSVLEGYTVEMFWWGDDITQLLDEVEDRRLFHTFRTITSGHFSGESDTGFWSGLLLQACHVNFSVRHAAIALASLHEEFMSHHRNTDQNEKISFEHYSKAVEGIRRSILTRDQPVIITIMSCALFSCFESFRGQLATAVMHLRSGLDIILAHVKMIDSTALRSIFLIFTRIGFQANYFVDNTNHAQLVDQLQSLSASQIDPVPTFENIQASLYSCLNGSMFSGQKEEPTVELTSLGLNYHMTKCAQLIISGSNTPGFIRGRELAIRNLERWQNVFDNHVQTQNEVGEVLNVRALTLLKLHHLVAMMMLSVEHNPSRAAKDFNQIIDWSKFLLVSKSALPKFLPDVGIIAPLFFVATKGPNAILRGQAREILASEHRREGIWDSEVATKILIEHHNVGN